MTALVEYLLRIGPGFALAVVLLAIVPRTLSGARLCVYLVLFVLLRDAMTPVGLWQIGDRPVFWLRLSNDAALLIALALGTAGLCAGMLRLEPALARPVVWLRGAAGAGLAAGVGCALLIAAPAVALAWDTPVAARGGAVAANLLVPLLVFALVGNAYEELLFRGFLQTFIAERIGAAKAVWISGLGFAFGHVFLSATVTGLGVPILVFTAYEGMICAELYRRVGLLPAVLAHGGAIFLLASGLG